ncbi:MAG: glucuronate isomerase [Clostridia bacterium]|nr:glucuronate isomerase [Clostridia bacterium]
MAKEFMGSDFLLENEPAKVMFAAAEKMPIFDWHCHLSPKEIYENKEPADIAELWLAGDHYKWRAMRSCGIEEKYITGCETSGYEKFRAFASCMPALIGNPMYHWCHLELRRYFGINEILSEETADIIWEKANAKVKAGGFTPRELISRSDVTHLCTTDDPADSLEYHKLLAAENLDFKVLPAFRPDNALSVELPGFAQWLRRMEETACKGINTYKELKNTLKDRIEYFASLGCRASDHAFSYVPCEEAGEQELEEIFARGKAGEKIDRLSADKYKTDLLRFLAREYAARGWGMELHIGPIRNNNSKMFAAIGPDAGFDSIDDYAIAAKLSAFLDSLAREDKLPRTVLFCLNPKDNYVLGSMLGNFQSSEAESKIQFGSAWWFNDNIDGMREQMKALGNLGALGKFVGMVTDSRSFLSYPRHEYFRRIMCNLLGEFAEKGLYPYDEKTLCKIVEDISYNNAIKYFGVK